MISDLRIHDLNYYLQRQLIIAYLVSETQRALLIDFFVDINKIFMAYFTGHEGSAYLSDLPCLLYFCNMIVFNVQWLVLHLLDPFLPELRHSVKITASDFTT